MLLCTVVLTCYSFICYMLSNPQITLETYHSKICTPVLIITFLPIRIGSYALTTHFGSCAAKAPFKNSSNKLVRDAAMHVGVAHT